VVFSPWTWSLKAPCLPVRNSFAFVIGQLHNRVMKIRKGYKYRLKTDRTRIQQFSRFAGACRFVWNEEGEYGSRR
jgi:Helix-turn-helix domain